jgi:hypothetical protein
MYQIVTVCWRRWLNTRFPSRKRMDRAKLFPD